MVKLSYPINQSPHDYQGNLNETSHPIGVLPCPVCGTPLELRLLELNDEDAGTTELLMLLDCTTGDYQGTLTKQDAVKIIADEVIRRMR